VIYTYGVSLPGTDHIENGIPNQDSYEIAEYSDTLVIAAVADGLGSAEFSDIASKIAVQKSVEYCEKNIRGAKDGAKLLDVIEGSFSAAQKAIEKEVAAKNRDITQYDTTLTLAVLWDDRLFYGHSGDSGIVALTTQGLYKTVTEKQVDENNCVFPLFFEDRWVFKEYEERVSSVFLATDGMLDILFPLYIRNEDVNIHINLARFFMDNERLQIEKYGEDDVEQEIEHFMQNIPAAQVSYDKTVVVLINTAIRPALQPESYYKEPDWAELKRKYDEEWKRLAYPHLFSDEADDKGDNDADIDTEVKPETTSAATATALEEIRKACERQKIHPFGVK
jgi:hypothetical protein